jgi:pilus assembly protein CpaD
MIRHLLVLSLAGAVTACASSHGTQTAKVEPARSPTTQFSVTLTHSPDEILLAPHASGLSVAQAAAVGDLVERWRDAGSGPVTIQTPAGGGSDAYRSTMSVQGALARLGLTEDQVKLVSYQAAAGAAASPTGVTPIVVGFTHFEATGPKCGRDIHDFTKTYTNQPNNNFGCAVTANFAAMLANPADLANPRPVDAPDANRRETIFGHYRKGELMSSAKDPQANGAVSSVLQ